MNKPLESSSDYDLPVALGALVQFLKWASQYGHEIRPTSRFAERGVVGHEVPVMLELSTGLSASFNFGYEPSSQSVFMALDPEEYEWLPKLPITEVVVGREEVYVLTSAIELEEVPIDAMAFTIRSGQPKLWRAFPNANNVGFVHLSHAGASHEVIDVYPARFPLRFLND